MVVETSDDRPPAARAATTRDRIVQEAMRLFGEQGFEATTVAQLEAAVGLAPGAGGIYRHFPSKVAILEEGIARQIRAQSELLRTMGTAEVSVTDQRQQLAGVARAGMARLEQERDINRLLFRDLRLFPELLERVRDDDLTVVFRALVSVLRTTGCGNDPEALAAVLMGAVSHYWLLRDIFGEHPFDVDEARYLDVLVDLVVPPPAT